MSHPLAPAFLAIDAGQAVFITDHTQFGTTAPSNTILYWDGTSLTEVADDDTPVPDRTFDDHPRPTKPALTTVHPRPRLRATTAYFRLQVSSAE